MSSSHSLLSIFINLKYYSFELDPSDPNFNAYAEGAEDPTKGIKYYWLQADRMKAEEKVTLFIDFNHIG